MPEFELACQLPPRLLSSAGSFSSMDGPVPAAAAGHGAALVNDRVHGAGPVHELDPVSGVVRSVGVLSDHERHGERPHSRDSPPGEVDRLGGGRVVELEVLAVAVGIGRYWISLITMFGWALCETSASPGLVCAAIWLLRSAIPLMIFLSRSPEAAGAAAVEYVRRLPASTSYIAQSP